ncbi:flagellar protein FliT [Pseudocitrobacter cyperus]|uniref:Flagellar protein FliT n=1 Tax=Pseudocitrobacter cyperus TaxID=3112843 RepID=A0ABV0HQQ6_9ENTR
MDNDIMLLIEQMQVSNAKLLRLADAGEWEAFFDESMAYSIGMRTLSEVDLTQLARYTRTEVTAQLTHLLERDAHLTRAIQARMAVISSELSTMRKSRASAKAYTAV